MRSRFDDRLIEAVTTRSTSTPRSVCSRRTRLRPSSSEPTRSTTDTASSAIVKARRIRRPLTLCDAPTPLVRSASGRLDCSAGTTPVTSVVRATRAHVKSRTNASTWTASSRGTSAGFKRDNVSTMPTAMRIPAMPPSAARRAVSTINCLTSCVRDAPSARRTAISRARPALRAIKRFMTLAQVTQSTRATAANNITSDDRTDRTRAS